MLDEFFGLRATAEDLFDRDHYAAASRAFRPSLGHYRRRGWRQGLNPGPNFDTEFYLASNLDVRRSGTVPLDHYVEIGQFQGRRPNPEADPTLILSSTGIEVHALLTDHLDRGHYLSQLSGPTSRSDIDPVMHYLATGHAQGLSTMPRFDPVFYVASNEDIRREGLDPQIHYIRFGWTEGRQSRPGERLILPEPSVLETADAIRDYIDAEHYVAQVPYLRDTTADLALHYLQFGARSGLSPRPDFDPEAYLAKVPGLNVADETPLGHALRTGGAPLPRLVHDTVAPDPEDPDDPSDDDLDMMPSRRTPALPPASPATDEELDAIEAHFDPEFYRQTNPEIDGDDRALMRHYMEHGWRELRDPSPAFSTRYYLDSYPDISAGGHNPLLHYAVFGQDEGRRASAHGPQPLARNRESPDIVPEELRAVLATAPGGVTPPDDLDPGSLRIDWVIPDFAPGAGGHMTIFRMIRFLEQFGHRCRIWIQCPTRHTTPESAYDDILRHFQCVEAEVRFTDDGLLEATGDVLMATAWSTAFLVDLAPGFARKGYFIQDHEPEFYPTGADAHLARMTYGFEMAYVCASPWLRGLMSDRYGRWAREFWLAYDPELYRLPDTDNPLERPDRIRRRIAVYARDHTARRCVALALTALEHLGRLRDDFEVHFFGQDRLSFSSTNFAAFSHGVMRPEALAELYRDCDLGICFSGTNYSLVPQEMMACGLPVVELDTESTRAIFPPQVVAFCGPHPASIAETLAELLDSPDRRDTLARSALHWVKDFNWERSARDVESALLDYLAERRGGALPAPGVVPSRERTLDVVIPTWNGLGEIEPVIAALRSQVGVPGLQIHCVDSSSSDGTTEWLRAQPDISTTVIPQSEFQHGRTRNLGAGLGQAPVIAFLTQDALPATPYWALDILKMFGHFPEGVGLFGRHIAYPQHPLMVRREISEHFANLGQFPLALSRDTDPEKWESGNRGWRQVLHFYSDNNSAFRRDIWREHPYPEVDYGEDQMWAREIIEAGLTKLYAPTATVYHSHDYDARETYKRSRTEAEFFNTYFGYDLGRGSDEAMARRIEREQAAMRVACYRSGVPEEHLAKHLANIEAKHRGWRDGRALALQKAETEEPA